MLETQTTILDNNHRSWAPDGKLLHFPARKRVSLGIYLFHKLQEKIRNPAWRGKLSRLICLFLPRANTSLNAEQARSLQKIQADGFCPLPTIVTDAWIENVLASIVKLRCVDPWKQQLGSFDIDNVPAETHVAQIPDIISLPAVYEMANHPDVLGIVEQYLGCKPTIDSIQAWWSLPGHETAEEAENFHRDNDSIRFVKFFLYLTDVTPSSGPHAFMRGSHRSSDLLRTGRFTDEEVIEKVGRDKLEQFVGPRGLAFLEDTYGLHKGSLPISGKRLLLQVRYSVTPTVFLTKSKVVSPQYPWQNYSNRYLWKAR